MTKDYYETLSNWAECREAARDLGQEHPTVARAVSSADTVTRRTEGNAVLNDPDVRRALGRLRDVTRVRNLAIRTEQTYSEWAERFARFCKGPFPEDSQRVVAFLEHLALVEKVAPATQAQALNALVFLYRHVLKVELGDLGGYQRPQAKRKLPVVLSPAEVDRLLAALPDMSGLMQQFSLWRRGRRMEGVESAGRAVACGWGDVCGYCAVGVHGGVAQTKGRSVPGTAIVAKNRSGKGRWRWQGTIRPGVTVRPLLGYKGRSPARAS